MVFLSTLRYGMSFSSNYSDDLLIYRYRNGVKLVRPDLLNQKNFPYFYNTGHSIAQAFSLPVNMAFLNTDGAVEKVNEISAMVTGFSSAQAALGKTIFDVAIRKTAEEVVSNDRQVMRYEKTMIFEETIIYKNERSMDRLQVITPWYNEDNKIIGVFGCNIINGADSFSEKLAHIMQLGLLSTNNSFSSRRFNLTKRQTEIVHHIVRGKSARVTAAVLNISLRTVEQHLENIKIKMGVVSKTALIEKIMDEGF